MKNTAKKLFLLTITIILIWCPTLIFGQSASSYSTLTLSVAPRYDLPVSISSDQFGNSLSGSITVAYKPPISFPLYASIDFGYSYMPFNLSWANPLHIAMVAGGIGLDYNFLGRLAFDIYAKGGYYETILQNLDGNLIYGGNPYLEAGGGLSFYLTPRFKIGIGSSYRQFFGLPGDLYRGVGFYIGSSYRFPLSGNIDIEPPKVKPARLKIADIEINRVFPVFYKYYDDHPIGKVTVVNEEKGEIRDIEVSFFIKQYMDNPKTYKLGKNLKRKESSTIDVYALFNEAVLGITEGTKVSSELVIRYTYKGEQKKKTLISTIPIENRNASIWDDDRRAAAFITAKDPAVLKLSKNLAGMIREEKNKVFGKDFMLLTAIHNALSEYGITYVVDPNTPYRDFHEKKEAIDFLQFPRQTLEYKAGDCDDLSILYAALLEASSVNTALITVPGHIYIAVDLGMKPAHARSIFYDTDNLIIRNERVWLPFEVTMVQSDFLKAWKEGAREWNKYQPLKKANFYTVYDSWKVFEPVGFPGDSSGIELPATAKIAASFRKDLNSAIRQEVRSKADDLKERIAKSGSYQLINRLGILYARYGLFDDAELQFKKLLEKSHYRDTGLINIGNIRYKKGDFKGALEYYNEALKNQPDNSKLLLNIARAHYQMEEFQIAEKLYKRVSVISPELAKSYQYLGTRADTGSRAASAEEMGSVLWGE